MRRLPLETTTTGNGAGDRDEQNTSKRSSPAKQRRNGGERGEAQDESLPLETEKLRAGIQQLLSSAPVLPPQSPAAELRQHKATPKRRGVASTPRRAAASATTATTPASNAVGPPSSSRPRRSQLSLFSVSKPPLAPGAAQGLRERREKETMEGQAPPAAATSPAVAASPAGGSVSESGRDGSAAPTPSSVARVPPPPPLPAAAAAPALAAFRAAFSAVNASRADAGPPSVTMRMQPQHNNFSPAPPSPGVFAAGASASDAAAAAATTATTPLRAQHQQQQQQQVWASPAAQVSQQQQQNSNSRRLSFHLRPQQPPPSPSLPAGGVDDVYRDFPRQQEAADFADGVNRLAFAELMRRAEEEEQGEAGDEGRAPRPLFAPTIDDDHLFDQARCRPDPELVDVESLPTALYEPVKVFCVEVPVDNPAAATAATASPEKPRTHYRRFVAASYSALLRRYLSQNAASTGGRHVYEVLRESRPCHAYFDVEYSKRANPGVDGDSIVDALVEAVRAELSALIGSEAAEATLVLESDSSTPSKFSRHLILRLPGKLAFKDNASVGRLLAEVLSRDGASARLRVAKDEPNSAAAASPLATQRRETAAASPAALPPSYRHAICAPSSAAYAWVSDTAVYTKNRHFRVLWSSKGGKSVALEPTERHAHARGAPLDAARTPMRVLTLASLAANVEPGTKLLDLGPGFLGGSGARVAIAGVVSAPGCLGSSGGSSRVVRRETTLYRSSGRPIKFEWKHDALDGVSAGGGRGGKEEQENRQPDPRLVEAALAAVPFVEELQVKRAGSTAPGASVGDAYVRSAAVIGAQTEAAATDETTPLPPLRSAVVAFSLLGPASRWCEFVGRRHRSNHVFFVLDFSAGTWVQKCYDPDCAAKKSAAGSIPEDLLVRVDK